jgi:hypothetical protein
MSGEKPRLGLVNRCFLPYFHENSNQTNVSFRNSQFLKVQKLICPGYVQIFSEISVSGDVDSTCELIGEISTLQRQSW